MIRYNHAVIERKWRKRWAEEENRGPLVAVQLVPKEAARLDLENGRLVLVSHFLATILAGEKPQISLLGAAQGWLGDARALGVAVQDGVGTGRYDLMVLPRDYARTKHRNVEAALTFLPGRLLETGGVSLGHLLPDFGVDACRVYVLFLGPLERDYVFSWHGLASAHRFVARVWQLAQTGALSRLEKAGCDGADWSEICDLRFVVRDRLGQKKPHTALAAIMGYVRHRSILTATETRVIAELLAPFTPFLSSELLELVATV
ncbi:MAG: hypothetical protein M0R49_09700 [Limnochordia bacterium]|jgi:hypothetical protein|nr:hypothetical protein [Limnochordia bacterium]